VQSRYYRVGIVSILLVLALAILVGNEWSIFPSVFSFLQSGAVPAAMAVIIDLGILLLIVYEDFGKPYFLDRGP